MKKSPSPQTLHRSTFTWKARTLCRAGALAAGLTALFLAAPSHAASSFPPGVDGYTAPDGALILTLEGETGIENAPLPESFREDLLADFEVSQDPDKVYIVNQRTAEAIHKSIATGRIDPYLLSEDEQEQSFGGCQTEIRTRTKHFEYDWNGTRTAASTGRFEGSMDATATVAGETTLEVRYEVKRWKILWIGPCISYWVSPKSVRAHGDLSVDGVLDIQGGASYTQEPWDWEWELATVELGSLSFSVAKIPVTIEFDLPITAGLTLRANAEASLDFNSTAYLAGSYDYTCRKWTCTGDSDFQVIGFGDGSLEGLAEGRIQADGYLDVAARAQMRTGPLRLVKGQLGIRGVAYADFWAYFGNQCGDRDDDGTPEWVRALTLNIDLQGFANAELEIIFLGSREWPDIDKTDRRFLYFIDLIGSDAIEPIFRGPSSMQATKPSQFSFEMPSCWPYTDPLDFEVNWGDGTVEALTVTPGTSVTGSHTYAQANSYDAELTAVADHHGRYLGRTTERRLDATGLLATLECATVGGPIVRCDGGGVGGTAPYFPEWRVLGDPLYSDQWEDGDFVREYQCKRGQNYTVQLRIFDSAGQADIASWSCNNGPF